MFLFLFFLGGGGGGGGGFVLAVRKAFVLNTFACYQILLRNLCISISLCLAK